MFVAHCEYHQTSVTNYCATVCAISMPWHQYFSVTVYVQKVTVHIKLYVDSKIVRSSPFHKLVMTHLIIKVFSTHALLMFISVCLQWVIRLLRNLSILYFSPSNKESHCRGYFCTFVLPQQEYLTRLILYRRQRFVVWLLRLKSPDSNLRLKMTGELVLSRSYCIE